MTERMNIFAKLYIYRVITMSNPEYAAITMSIQTVLAMVTNC